MGWHLLESLLQQVGEHATLVGKLWVTGTFVFRFVIVACVGDAVYSDEQSDFKCNTETPGCGNVCFNEFSPISHLRFWAAQIIAVCTPSIVFIVYATHVLTKSQNNPEPEHLQDEEEQTKELLAENLASVEVRRGSSRKGRKPSRKSCTRSENANPRRRVERTRLTKGSGNISGIHASVDADDGKRNEQEEANYRGEGLEHATDVDSSLADIEKQLAALEREEDKRSSSINKRVQFAYVIALLLRTGSEAVFIWLQYVLYGFSVPEIYYCQRKPCPHTVDCFVSRPQEKTIFLWFMFIVSCICLALNIIEIKYLGMKKLMRVLFSSNTRGSHTTLAGAEGPLDVISAATDSITNVKDLGGESRHKDRTNNGKRTRFTSDEDSIGFDDIGKPPSYPLPGYPRVHTYGVLLSATPTAPASVEIEKSYL